ncbi:hypothetical protein L209DRAFT_756033 [Thermothelomyces heterothallicus CBS 203.75]
MKYERSLWVLLFLCLYELGLEQAIFAFERNGEGGGGIENRPSLEGADGEPALVNIEATAMHALEVTEWLVLCEGASHYLVFSYDHGRCKGPGRYPIPRLFDSK